VIEYKHTKSVQITIGTKKQHRCKAITLTYLQDSLPIFNFRMNETIKSAGKDIARELKIKITTRFSLRLDDAT